MVKHGKKINGITIKIQRVCFEREKTTCVFRPCIVACLASLYMQPPAGAKNIEAPLSPQLHSRWLW
jgi:hypothetical protein